LRPNDMIQDCGTLLAEGGEAKVFRQGGKVAKLFHQPTDDRREKLTWMISHPLPPLDVGGFSDSAWPEALLFSESGAFVGYEAPYLAGMQPLVQVTDVNTRVASFKEWTYRHSLKLGQNMAHNVSRLHSHGLVIGDVSPANVLISPGAATSALIDLDSVQIRAGKKLFPCTVSTPHYTAPEVLSGNVSLDARTIYQDNYSLAVLLFELLLEYHPFAAVLPGKAAPSPDQRVLQNLWVGNRAAGKVRPPRFGLALATLTNDCRQLFERAFNDGSLDPAKRPSAFEWTRGIAGFYKSLVRCPRMPAHHFSNQLASCPWCEKLARTGVDSFAG
jgi:DNA-binding helix-hairpin-helix protein with protein kinase domain